MIKYLISIKHLPTGEVWTSASLSDEGEAIELADTFYSEDVKVIKIDTKNDEVVFLRKEIIQDSVMTITHVEVEDEPTNK